jgi:hypothetical protein
MMENTIREIIEKQIPAGAIFDTHAVIEYLVQYHSDEYLSSFTGGGAAAYGGKIGQAINSFDGTLIDRAGDSWSANIRKNFSKDTCWKKR